MKILFLSQRVPYPPNRGDKITTWRVIERMSRNHDVTSIAFAHDQADLDAVQELRQKGIDAVGIPHNEKRKKLLALPLLATQKPLTLGVYGSRQLQEEVDRRIQMTDVAYAYSSSMGAFLLPHTLPWIMHFAELDSDKWKQYSEKARFPASFIYRREFKTLLTFEKKLASAARQCVFCTPLEESIFKQQIPGRPSVVMRNGVDLSYFTPSRSTAEPAHLVFTGVMDYLPNVDGCVHFVNDILPLVREEFPETRFTIIGSRPSQDVQDLARVPGVTVTGFVQDTRDHLRLGAIAVAPLRIARGIQNKVLEALAMGLPVVGTTCATQGVEGTPGEHFLVADDAEGQAAALRELLRDPEKGWELGARGRHFVEDHYDWDVTLEPLDEMLDQCCATAAPTP